MHHLIFKGRGFKDVRVTITSDWTGVLIRADCAENEEAWAEVTLPLPELFELLERAVVAHPLCVPEMLAPVTELRRKLFV